MLCTHALPLTLLRLTLKLLSHGVYAFGPNMFNLFFVIICLNDYKHSNVKFLPPLLFCNLLGGKHSKQSISLCPYLPDHCFC